VLRNVGKELFKLPGTERYNVPLSWEIFTVSMEIYIKMKWRKSNGHPQLNVQAMDKRTLLFLNLGLGFCQTLQSEIKQSLCTAFEQALRFQGVSGTQDF
jgi:hypothetical protein